MLQSVMQLNDVDTDTPLGAYNPNTGEYRSLGQGWQSVDTALQYMDEETDWQECMVVAELIQTEPAEHATEINSNAS